MSDEAQDATPSEATAAVAILQPRMRRTWLIRSVSFGVPALIGVIAVVLFQVLSEGPERTSVNEASIAVRTIRVSVDQVVPRHVAVGVVQAPKTWRAVAQVSGEVVYRSPNAEVGRFVEAGEVLLRIDREEYEIAVRQVHAATTETNARIENLDSQEASTLKLIEVERESLDLLETNYDRIRESFNKGASSPSEVDDARREYLSQLARVTDLESVLNGYPSDRAALEATLEVNQADLANAQLALRRTELAAPFSGRVTVLSAEEAEFVSIGHELLTVADISRAEVVVNSSPDQLRQVVSPSASDDAAVGIQAMKALLEERVIAAMVRLPLAEPNVVWAGSLDRVGASLDPGTRTLPIYVLVDDPYGQFSPGSRPPLIEEMFCEVELRAEAVADRTLIPRSAYHGGFVHLVQDDRLVRRPVEATFRIGDYIAVTGIEPDAVLIVSYLPFVLEGMLLTSSTDEALEERIRAIAGGEGQLR